MMAKPNASVFVLMGQSNAVGYATRMTENDKMITPLKNVYGLTRTHNLSYDNQELVWTGYTSHDTILGEENDHTYSVANCLARFWQDAIDGGADLPDLYIINIAIGAQGVTSKYMWHPKREPVLVPGALGTVNISLCPFTAHIFSLLRKSFEAMGKTYEIIGLHWRGGENDYCEEEAEVRPVLKGIYQELFQIFYDNLGEVPPIILHRIVTEDCVKVDTTGTRLRLLHFINGIFEELERENENISIFDVREAPHCTPTEPGRGLFIEDLVHFTPKTNQWVAHQILEKEINRT